MIGIGGDRLPGTTYVDALEMLAHDPFTEGKLFPMDTVDDSDNIDRRAWWNE